MQKLEMLESTSVCKKVNEAVNELMKALKSLAQEAKEWMGDELYGVKIVRERVMK